jgi:hypothetical protein
VCALFLRHIHDLSLEVSLGWGQKFSVSLLVSEVKRGREEKDSRVFDRLGRLC